MRLTEDNLKEVAQVLTYKSFNANEMVFDYGQPGDKFYIILDGIVDILIPVECKPVVELKE